jgi:hypothetical protein
MLMFLSRRMVTPMAACLSLVALPAAGAQRGSSPYSTSITVTNGFTANSHVDRNASPLTFSGLGFDAALGFRRVFGPWSFSTTLDGARRSYSTRLNDVATFSTAAPSTETSFDGRLAVSLVRELGKSPSHGLGVGLFGDVSGSLLRHRYADPLGTVSDYVHGIISFGPEVTWRQSIGDGMAHFDITTPLVGFVHRPYADTRSVRPAPRFEFATPSDLRAFNAGVSYESSLQKRFGIFAAYRLRALDLPQPQSYRALSNTLSAGVVARLGREKK